MNDPLKPSMNLLVKLGSIVVHTEEMLSPTGHPFDKNAVDLLLRDSEVKGWLRRMGDMALLPVRR